VSDEPTTDSVADGVTLIGAGTLVAGRYHLERLLGSGGMAQVWEATDQTLGRKVAVKVLHPHLVADDSFVKRFRKEAIAAARLTHPGIVGVYDTCSDGTHEAIVMELLDARTLREVLDERGTLDAESVRRIGLRLLDALEAAHRAGLVHRDVKPSNILLCTDGRVKIADFGIAKAEDSTELTRDGSLVGTASYLAPEQLEGQPVDGRTDLYALGIVLYECLAGRIPFGGDSSAAVALARLHTDPVDPRRFRSDVPPKMAQTIMSALARDPGARFTDAAEFRASLLFLAGDTQPQAVVQAPPEVREDPGTQPGFGRSERRWLLPALGILLIGTALVVAGLLLRSTSEDSTAPTTTLPPDFDGPRFSAVSTFDPSGTGEPGENDDLAPLSIDGDSSTAWRTEQYEDRGFFPGKDGVGLVLELASPSTLDRLDVVGSDNGWSGEVHLLQEGEPMDPDAPPAATLSDVRSPRSIPLGGARADGVLLWITDLGNDAGSHTVEIAEVSAQGTALQ
jgi:serine/threonine protein kinase